MVYFADRIEGKLATFDVVNLTTALLKFPNVQFLSAYQRCVAMEEKGSVGGEPACSSALIVRWSVRSR